MAIACYVNGVYTRVKIYVDQMPIPSLFGMPNIEPAKIQVDVIEGDSSGKDKIICSMNDEHYLNGKREVLTEKGIADYSGVEYGKRGFTADGNSRLIFRVKSDKPGYAIFCFGEYPENCHDFEKLKDRSGINSVANLLDSYIYYEGYNWIFVWGLSDAGDDTSGFSVETEEISSGVHQASLVIKTPENFPDSKKFPSDKFKLNVIFVTKEELALRHHEGYYHLYEKVEDFRRTFLRQK